MCASKFLSGADPKASDKYGTTPLNVARRDDVKAFLRSASTCRNGGAVLGRFAWPVLHWVPDAGQHATGRRFSCI